MMYGFSFSFHFLGFARTSVYLAVSDDAKDISGKYFYDDALKQPMAHALDEDAADKLWQFSEQLVKEYEEKKEGHDE